MDQALLEQLFSQIPKEFKSIFPKESSLQENFAITNYEMEELYDKALAYYENNLFKKSFDYFHLLVILNPYCFRYWLGFAAAEHLLTHYENALHAYAVAALLDSDNPYPHFHAYECYQALNNQSDAEKALQLAYQRAMVNPIYGQLQKKIEVLL